MHLCIRIYTRRARIPMRICTYAKKKRNGDTIVTVVGIAIAVVMELVNSRSGGSDSSTKSVYKLLHKRHV